MNQQIKFVSWNSANEQALADLFEPREQAFSPLQRSRPATGGIAHFLECKQGVNGNKGPVELTAVVAVTSLPCGTATRNQARKRRNDTAFAAEVAPGKVANWNVEHL
tara:strand:- start:7201 stop:7521 length:321 start_codon:yes stop_codon:yes gene_type:complete